MRRRETLAYIRTEPTVRLAILMIVLLTLLAVPIASLLPAIADQIDDDAHALGVLTAFYAVGGSLVALVLRRIREEYPKVRLVDPVLVVCGASLVVIGCSATNWAGPAGCSAWSASSSRSASAWRSPGPCCHRSSS